MNSRIDDEIKRGINLVGPHRDDIIKSSAETVEKVRIIAEALGLEIYKDLPAKEIGIIVGDAINKLNREIGIPTLKDLKVPESDLPAIAQDAIEDPCSNFAPKKMTVDDLLQLLQKVYAA